MSDKPLTTVEKLIAIAKEVNCEYRFNPNIFWILELEGPVSFIEQVFIANRLNYVTSFTNDMGRLAKIYKLDGKEVIFNSQSNGWWCLVCQL